VKRAKKTFFLSIIACTNGASKYTYMLIYIYIYVYTGVYVLIKIIQDVFTCVW